MVKIIKKKLIKNFSYPKQNDEDIQAKIFKKREFYYHKIPNRPKFKNYEDIKKFRNEKCNTKFIPREQQAILTNFISPNTPYNGILLMHGTGTGKTCTAISLAEQFKEQVKKYNTKIFILTFGPNNRETFKSELLFCTGNTYLKQKELIDQMTKNDADREKKIGIYGALQYYKILSYKTFYRKVLGEKIKEDKILDNNKVKRIIRKTNEGEIERELVIDKITNMNNTILIVDEAHNLTDNEYGEALKKIIKVSKNLKVILLTATPMKNKADDIIHLINFIKPEMEQLKREKIFTSDKNYNMDIKQGGLEYFKKMVSGYVSFYRGNMPYIFADRIDEGKISKELLFTPTIKCMMNNFQLNTYNKASSNEDDTLDRAASAAANFVFPGLNNDKTKLIGLYSTDGLNKLLAQINTDKIKLINLINKKIFNNGIKKIDINNFIKETDKKGLESNILKLEYIKFFSIKFYNAIYNILQLVDGKKGSYTSFVYSNLVKAGGMELFAQALIENGFLEYKENDYDYEINDNTIDYRTGKTFSDFKKNNKDLSKFKPATFILITGGSDDNDDIPEIKQKIIRDVFNNPLNKNGKLIKIVLGSKVMNEGVTLENVREVHILDVHYNLNKVDQVIGRAIRQCKHQAVITDDYKFPKVSIYRYVVGLKNKLSTDEVLYKKGELKYLLVKKIERAIKEVAFDCPLLLHGNKFIEEIDKYKGCVYPTLENKKKAKLICPAICDFQDCNLKCHSKKLNSKYWDKKNKTYRNLKNEEIDYNTFNDNLSRFEINNVIDKIKDLFRFKHIYLYNEMLEIIKKSYKSHQSRLFKNYFLDQALESVMPITENDFNNFTNTIYDKFNRRGYIIQRDEYYLFQPYDENEDVPLYYRKNVKIPYKNLIPVSNYIYKNYGSLKNQNKKDIKNIKEDKKNNYDYDSVLEYYDNRMENFIIGIIDKNLNKLASNDIDLFKIREKRNKELEKKRGTGIPTFKGAVCSTSKDKYYLLKLLKKLPLRSNEIIKKANKMTREKICNEIKNILLYLEKYSTSKNKNKITYVMIPVNHPIYPFPYNLEDRIKYILNKIKDKINRKFDYIVKKNKNGIFLNKRNNDYVKYNIELKDNKYFKQNLKFMKQINAKYENKKWNIIIE